MKQIVEEQLAFFQTGKTKYLSFRSAQLEALRKGIIANESRIEKALKKDLNKAPMESHATEIGFVLGEIKDTEKNLRKWATPQKVKTPLTSFPATSQIYPEPYGVTLIMSPWNYPFQLAMTPLIGAISGGNCAVLKLPEYTPTVSSVIAELIEDIFPPMYVTTVVGGRKENTALLKEKFDYIFFTGSPTVGKVVMKAASKHLTPVSLELGGKSPCIVTRTADIPMAAKRITWGKLVNAGQTCVAPDYLLVDPAIKEDLIEAIIREIKKMYGKKPLSNEQFPKIVNEHHFHRLENLIATSGDCIYGGKSDPQKNKIEPTILDYVQWSDPVMQEEIFGPIFPILTYNSLEEAFAEITARPKPLALYLFSRDKKTQKRVLKDLSFGGGCINETLMHMVTPYMPFGGVGESGMGGYHGKWSFDTFTHYKSVLNKANWFEPPVRYAPYTKVKEQVIRWLMG